MTEKENLLLVLQGRKPEWVPDFFQAASMEEYISLGYRKTEEPGLWKNAFGVVFRDAPDGKVPVYGPEHPPVLDDIKHWRDVMPAIDLDQIDWGTEAKTIRDRAGKEKAVSLHAGFIWEELYWMMGMEEAMVALMTEPETVAECLDAIAEFWISALRRIYPCLKPELVMLFDHIATHQGLMMSPKVYREVIKPADRKFFAAALELGACTMIHIDGYIEELLPDFSEIGVKVIQPFQVFNDINAAKEKYGFVAIGGWDAFGPGTREDSSEEDIRRSVRIAMDKYSPGNRYVFWESGVTPVFKRNCRIIADEAYKYGRQITLK